MSSILLFLALASVAEPERLVIPDEFFLAVSTSIAPGCDDADRKARLESVARAAIADRVDIVGHVERVAGTEIYLLGRRVDTEQAEIRGGGRESLQPGELLRVQGTGQADGGVRATLLEVQPPRDPTLLVRLDREIAKFEEKYWKKAKKLEDPALVAYVQGIVDRLMPSYLPLSDRRLRVIVVADPDLNAFALPNGTIVVHSGIIARMENEAQLASVLGHEMAHITNRHTIRAMSKETEHTLVGWGSFLAALALGASGKGDAAQGVQLMSSAWLSGYSRDHEDESDQVGLRYLYLAGYDVREAPLVWRTFQLLYGDMTREQNFFYGSHSTARDREHNLGQEVWKAYAPSGLVGGRIGREEFAAATAALVRKNALLDLERGNLAWAEWGIHRALAAAPEDAENQLALGRLELSRGGGRSRLEAAAEAFRRATELDPASARAQRELGYALRKLGDAEGARAALERYLALEPEAADAEQVRRTLARI